MLEVSGITTSKAPTWCLVSPSQERVHNHGWFAITSCFFFPAIWTHTGRCFARNCSIFDRLDRWLCTLTTETHLLCWTWLFWNTIITISVSSSCFSCSVLLFHRDHWGSTSTHLWWLRLTVDWTSHLILDYLCESSISLRMKLLFLSHHINVWFKFYTEHLSQEDSMDCTSVIANYVSKPCHETFIAFPYNTCIGEQKHARGVTTKSSATVPLQDGMEWSKGMCTCCMSVSNLCNLKIALLTFRIDRQSWVTTCTLQCIHWALWVQSRQHKFKLHILLKSMEHTY